ncbi:hypothetical protein [Rubrolithibacter danxiaensis]|uniref:hypothetical protein n=1 Tax=Rubrolithibacter danxiaensis TaxID=3390805 RepID=UPI003BF794C3
MKRLLLITAFSVAMLPALAQVTTTTPQTSSATAATSIAAGNWLVGGSVGSLGFNFSTETFNINIAPQAGYFVNNRTAIGAQVILGLSAYDGGNTVNYGVTPFIRYYLPEGSSPTGRWFGQVNAGIAGSSMKDSQQDEPVSLLLGAQAGYAHFVVRNVALEGTLGYNYTKADINTGGGISGLGVALGFQIYLPGRRNR